MISPFAKRVATIAEQQRARFEFMNEADPELCRQIQKWTEEIGFTFKSCTSVPWSAVFVSWCVKEAGATAEEFRFAKAHSVFVHQAIQNATAEVGVFRAFDIARVGPAVGDIIQFNRGGNRFDFAFATGHSRYESHSVIVVEVGQDTKGDFAFCIGGNESDSIRRTIVRLTAQVTIKQRRDNPFIAVVKNLK